MTEGGSGRLDQTCGWKPRHDAPFAACSHEQSLCRPTTALDAPAHARPLDRTQVRYHKPQPPLTAQVQRNQAPSPIQQPAAMTNLANLAPTAASAPQPLRNSSSNIDQNRPQSARSEPKSTTIDQDRPESAKSTIHQPNPNRQNPPQIIQHHPPKTHDLPQNKETPTASPGPRRFRRHTIHRSARYVHDQGRQSNDLNRT